MADGRAGARGARRSARSGRTSRLEMDRLELRETARGGRAAAGRGAVPARAPGGEARHLPAGRDRGRAWRRRSRSSSTASGSWRARSSRSAHRSSSPQILFEKLELSRKRRGKTGFSTDARVLRAIRDEHEIIPLIEKWRELSKLKSTYLDSLPALISPEHRPAAHDLQPDGDDDRAPVEHGAEPPEHPDPDGARPPDPQLLHRRGRVPADLRRLLAGGAAHPRARRRRGGAEGDLRARRGRARRRPPPRC